MPIEILIQRVTQYLATEITLPAFILSIRILPSHMIAQSKV